MAASAVDNNNTRQWMIDDMLSIVRHPTVTGAASEDCRDFVIETFQIKDRRSSVDANGVWEHKYQNDAVMLEDTRNRMLYHWSMGGGGYQDDADRARVFIDRVLADDLLYSNDGKDDDVAPEIGTSDDSGFCVLL